MSNTEAWETWEGRLVNGKFPLRQWVAGTDQTAIFLTQRPGQSPQKAAIKLIPEEAEKSDLVLSRWRAAAQLSHPHLMRIFETGRGQVDGKPFLYLVMEYAEEDLSQILPQRPLAPGEVSDMLPPLLDALSYLHAKGFVHGRIKPSNILAVGDQLKLSPDHIVSSKEPATERRRRDAYDAPEMAAGVVSPASDLWSVGVTLVAALTQNVSGDLQNAPALPKTIPEQFRGIARECLHLDPKQRCSIGDIRARLHPEARSVPAEPEPVPVPQRTGRPPIIVAAAVIVGVVVGFFIFHSRGKNSPAQSASPDQPVTQAAPAPAPLTTVTTQAPPVSRPAEAPKKTAASRGEVARQVLPEIPQSARNTITGTIKIGVQVEVDSSGKVTSAKLTSPGPSKYFANLALKASRQWEFSPAEVNGERAASTWLLQFRLKRTSTQASAQTAKR